METVPIEPRGLLAHAHGLASAVGVPGVPDATRWRRSTSAAYYAVFHALALAVAAQVAPGAPDADRYRLTRSVDHGRLADVCGWVGGAAPRPNVAPIVERLRHSGDLAALAVRFRLLRDARHGADYDHLAAVSGSAAAGHCGEADSALDLLDGLAGSADLREFLALVALHSALR